MHARAALLSRVLWKRGNSITKIQGLGRKDTRLESLADNNHVTITLELVSTTGVIRGAHKLQ